MVARVEYLITLRLASASGDPARWDWGALVEDEYASVYSCLTTGRTFEETEAGLEEVGDGG